MTAANPAPGALPLTKARRLRELLRHERPVVSPGV